MSPTRVQEHASTTPSVIERDNRRRNFLPLAAGLAFLVFLFVPRAYAGADFNLQSNPGAITLTTVGNNYTASFGNMNGLGIGTPATGVTAIKLPNGTLYYTTYQLVVVAGLPGTDSGYVTAYASANFGHPAALVLQSCPTSATCNASGSFSLMSTNSGTQTAIIAKPGVPKNTPVVAGLGIFVPDNNGASAFTGTDSVVITFSMFKNSDNSLIETLTLTLNSNTLQDAVQLQLGTATSGLTVTAASDYTMNFGNVNALGIGPSAGLSTSGQAGGIVYSTPYNILPAFSGFTSTGATIKVCVSTNFVHAALLKLEDSSTGSSGSFTPIPTACGSAVIVTSSGANRSTLTRYLGLYVLNINGPTAFTGTDTATLTYTLTVP